MIKLQTLTLVAFALTATTAHAGASAIPLGAADSFAVLGGSTVTNTGPTALTGDLGVWPGTAITGFPPGRVTGTIHSGDPVAKAAQADLAIAYGNAAAQACGTNLSGTDLGGLTLTPGVYCFNTSAQLTGTLTLNALGNSNAVFLFQVGTALTTASLSAVVFSGAGNGDSLVWQIGSSATIGSTSAFAGNILALTSITLDSGATIQCGRALAQNGAVTLDTNVVSVDTLGCETGSVPVAEPGLPMLLGLGGLLFIVGRRRPT